MYFSWQIVEIKDILFLARPCPPLPSPALPCPPLPSPALPCPPLPSPAAEGKKICVRQGLPIWIFPDPILDFDPDST